MGWRFFFYVRNYIWTAPLGPRARSLTRNSVVGFMLLVKTVLQNVAHRNAWHRLKMLSHAIVEGTTNAREMR